MNQNKKKVSIIIPVYNTELYLKDCFNSILQQDYDNIEVIVVNDCSTDNSLKICKQYEKKYGFIIINNEKNKGQAYSRNIAITKATGDYIAFLDSDDILYNNNISTLLKYAEKYNSDMVIARLNSFNSKGEYGYYSDKYINQFTIGNIFQNKMLINCISVCSKLYKSLLIKNIKFLENTFHEDNSFTLETLFNAKKIVVCPEYLYYRRIREDENNKSTMQKLDYKTFNDLILNYNDVLNNIQYKNDVTFLYKHMIKKLNNYLIRHVKKEDKSKAKESIKSFIDEFSLSKNNKTWLKFYNKIYYLFASLYGMVRK